jgi:elongation factor P--(R)-beta-lysine ligase
LTHSKWWQKDLHHHRRPLLLTRNALASAIRSYFAEEEFIEIDTAAMQVSPGNEAHIHAFPLTVHRSDGSILPRYLHTSPEFAMKKLLAAGESRIFSLGHVYRDRESGPLHAPEFTMLEWYRAGDTYRQIIDDCLHILRLAAETARVTALHYRQCSADPAGEPLMVSVAEAFGRFAHIDLLASCSPDGSNDRDALAAAARAAGLTIRDGDGWSDIFSRLLVSLVEPQLAKQGICVLHQYPRSEAALAAVNSEDIRLADRFELYACGVELANGFRELTDAAEQRRRFEAEMEEKQRIYGERYPIDEDFLEALAVMPEASGVALGFDRLVMLATGAPSIHHVIWTPAEDEGA